MDNFGQLIFTGISGTTLTDQEKDFIENEKIGGVILFDHNYEDPAQLAELVNSIQKIRDEYPLFIAVDHEGGRVQRFKKHFTHFPSMLALSSQQSPKLIFEVHQIMARELSACGINLCLSPCCDILTNESNKVIGDRSFGKSAEDVEKYISAAIRGLQTTGLLSCAKHFPGHGETVKDSHFDLPLLKTTVEELRIREMIPFIKASKSRVEFMMMAHLLVDSIDEKLPTSLSPKAYQFLRQETKFTKIVVTDDMEMGALSHKFSIEEAAVMALGAGADMLMYKTLPSAQRALGAIREAVKKKHLKKEDILDKVTRVERSKKDHFKSYNPIYIPKIVESFNTEESKKILSQLNGLSPSHS